MTQADAQPPIDGGILAAPGSRLGGLRGRMRHADTSRRFRCEIPETEPPIVFTAHKPKYATMEARTVDPDGRPKRGEARVLGLATLLAESCEGIMEFVPGGEPDPETGLLPLRTIHPDRHTVVKIDENLQQLLGDERGPSPFTGARLVVELCGEAGLMKIADELTDWAGYNLEDRPRVLPEA